VPKAAKLPQTRPFLAPFGSILAKNTPNLLAGGKNIGATHLTNGAYRLHPTEWAIGEAAGTLAAESVRLRRTPIDVYRDTAALRAVQRKLLEMGHPLIWFDDIKPSDPDFVAAQWGALTGERPLNNQTLHGR
jgi:hypothetical protein